jgi:AcrR family transcriptional regulator
VDVTQESLYDYHVSRTDSAGRPLRDRLSFRYRVRMLREDELRLLAAAHVLWKGCRNVRLDDVAAAAGVSRGTCYLHFPNRSAFLRAALAHLDSLLAARLAAPPPGVGTPREGVRWAILQAVSAQIHALSLRDSRILPDGGALAGKAWPCCLREYPCPYRGGALSLERITAGAHALRPPRRAPVSADRLAPLIVHLVPRLLMTGARGRGSRGATGIEPLVDYLIDRLIPS